MRLLTRTLLFLLASLAFAQAQSPEQLFRDAVAAQQRGDDATAIRKYQELLKIRPDVVEAHANLGATLARQGRFDEAIQHYRAALAKAEGNPALRLNLALVYYKKGDLPEAVKQLESLPANARIATLLGDCYARLGHDEQAVAILKPVEAAQPDDLDVAWILGAALIRSGHRREGLERVERVAKSGNSAEPTFWRGKRGSR